MSTIMGILAFLLKRRKYDVQADARERKGGLTARKASASFKISGVMKSRERAGRTQESRLGGLAQRPEVGEGKEYYMWGTGQVSLQEKPSPLEGEWLALS